MRDNTLRNPKSNLLLVRHPLRNSWPGRGGRGGGGWYREVGGGMEGTMQEIVTDEGFGNILRPDECVCVCFSVCVCVDMKPGYE